MTPQAPPLGAHRLHLTLAWTLTSVAGLFVALAQLSAAVTGGRYVPVGNDSFYHARRILDLLADPTSLHEFDPLVHYPEGSTLIWPWGYDFAMSQLLRLGMMLKPGADAMAVLDHLPVLAFPLALALVLVICRQLGVGLHGTLAALLATAFFPLNQGLYGVGSLDHHFAEHLFVLASLASGLAWLAKPDSRLRACLVGGLLGVAPCIHNGLFILQIPIVAVFALAWLRARPLPGTSVWFAGTLLAATLAASLPSSTLRQGSFAFYTLSWFHVYLAACAGVACVLFSRLKFSPRNLALLIGIGLGMLVPVVSQLLLAQRFLSVSVEGAARISETQSVWELGANRSGVASVASNYTWLIFLLPATIGLCAWRAWRESSPHRSLFWVTSLLGVILLASMVRMHPYGSFALYLPWIVLLQELVSVARVRAQTAGAFMAIALAAAYLPVLPGLFKPRITGLDPYYALTSEVYAPFAESCRRNPGPALANLDDGNYIRFHTDCAVIANNFLLTKFHESKLREVQTLMALPAAQLLAKAPNLKFVFVRRESLFRLHPDGRMQFIPGGDPQSPDPALVAELLAAPLDALPARFRFVKELAFEQPAHVPYARLFAIEPLTVARQTTSPATPGSPR